MVLKKYLSSKKGERLHADAVQLNGLPTLKKEKKQSRETETRSVTKTSRKALSFMTGI